MDDAPSDEGRTTTSARGTVAGTAAGRLFEGPGELRALCRALDWGVTPLGVVDGWPQSLRTAAALVLGSAFPSILVWGPELVQLYNDAYAPLIGRKHPVGLGMPTHACWPEIRAVQEPVFARVFAGETVHLADALYRLDRAGTGELEDAWFTATFVPVPLEEGGVGGSLSTLFETTAQVRARVREADHLRLLESMQEAFAAFDDEWRYVYVNRAAELLHGCPREAVLGRTVWECFPELRENNTWERALTAQREQRLVEYVTHLSSVGKWVRARNYPLPGGGMAAIVRDVTEEYAQATERERLLAEAQASRAEAEAANRAKSEFLAVMSHELRTPLNAIGGYAELMEMGIRGPVSAQQRDDLARIQRSQRHLLGLVNEVLNYAKLETGSVRYDAADVVVCEALAAAEGLVAPQARARGLRLAIGECPPGLAVRADPEKLRQILVNLLSNAVKFTDRGGHVTVTCDGEGAGAERGACVRIAVRDTGIGIAADKLEVIFEPFVQVRADLTRPHEGTGLGLAISRDLAHGMGGDLTAESAPGAGSTFTLTLPAA